MPRPISSLFPYTTLFRSASNLFLSLILHLGNLFLIVQLHFSKLFLILKSGVNHTSRGSISTSTLPSIKLRKCSWTIRKRLPRCKMRRSEERFSRNAETDIFTLSLHDALPICQQSLFESHFASRQSLSDCPVAF